MTTTTTVFMNGASQAVRLPKEFRFDADVVGIKRVGSAILLFPKDAAWDLMADAIGRVDEDFLPERTQPRRAGKRKLLVAKKRKRR
jgi:antitoxin VapB